MVAPLIPIAVVGAFTGAAYVVHRFTGGSTGESSGGNGFTSVVSGAVPNSYGASSQSAAPDLKAIFQPVIDALATPFVVPSVNTPAPATTTVAPATPATTTPATTTPATTTPATTTPATTTPAATATATVNAAEFLNVVHAAGLTTETTSSKSRGSSASLGNILFNPIKAFFGGDSKSSYSSVTYNTTPATTNNAPLPGSGQGSNWASMVQTLVPTSHTDVAQPSPNQTQAWGGPAQVGNAPVTGPQSSTTINIPFVGPVSVPLPATPLHTELQAAPPRNQTPIMDVNNVPVLGPLLTLVTPHANNTQARGPVAPVNGPTDWRSVYANTQGNSTQKFNAASKSILDNPTKKGSTWNTFGF